jgi:2-polyprenyl-3-methyl-5-hydroxy-6-metoxy-1,4-benzoquinol methylase
MQITRYQDFVIRDGRFIGEFDEMYRQFGDPWRQSEAANNVLSMSRNFTMLRLQKYQVRLVVEFGCGLGYFTDLIRRSTGAEVTAADILCQPGRRNLCRDYLVYPFTS